jgi:phosphomannomutase
MLRGDEVGALLGTALLTRGVTGTYAASIVSSTLLGKLAAAAGQPYAETLTGFKWISRVPGLVYGYEEALGYCVDPAHVRDKDGISALLLLCELAAALKAEGRTLVDLLDEIAEVHGLHATDQLSVRVQDLTEIGAAMARLRATPPTSLGGYRVEGVDDLAVGSADLPATDGLRYRMEGGARVIVRPSGTEPKLKCYLEVVLQVDPEDGVEAARIAAVGRLDALRDDIKAAAGV